MTVTLAPGLNTSPIGFGCMALSHVYGGTTNDQARHTLEDALDAGITFLDTADVYGEPRPDATGPAGTNEEMLAPFVARHRDQLQIATKFGITGALTVEKRSEPPTSGRPEYVRAACDASLRRLGIETIDLYYMHRPDPDTTIEETIGALSELIDAGKVRHLGLSEVTAPELHRAHAVHPIAAVQSEWSLWSRDVERNVVPACAELGVGFVPYSPLGIPDRDPHQGPDQLGFPRHDPPDGGVLGCEPAGPRGGHGGRRLAGRHERAGRAGVAAGQGTAVRPSGGADPRIPSC